MDSIQELRDRIGEEHDAGRAVCECGSCEEARCETDAALAAVEREMAELRKDKERLDWLDEKGDVYSGWKGYHPDGQYEFSWSAGRFGNRRVERDETTVGLRPVIDAARTAEADGAI